MYVIIINVILTSLSICTSLLTKSLAWLFNSHCHDCSTVTGAIFQQSLTRDINSCWHDSLTVTRTIVQQSLASLINSGWHDSQIVAGTIVQQSLAQLIHSNWYDCSTVADMILQQLLARLVNSHWHDCSTVVGMIVPQSLAWLFNSDWHDCSTFIGTIVQQLLARFFQQSRFSSQSSTLQDFFLCWKNSSAVNITAEESCRVPGIQQVILQPQLLENKTKQQGFISSYFVLQGLKNEINQILDSWKISVIVIRIFLVISFWA